MNQIKSSSEVTKLTEGWHFTEKYGEVYISPDGTAWTVQLIDEQLKSIPVNITSSDIIKSTAIDRIKDAHRKRLEYQRKVQRRQTSILTPQESTDA
jgi:hypothetical protein